MAFVNKVQETIYSIYVMFKTRSEVFYRDLKPRGVLDPMKHVPRVFLNVFINIPGKACVKRIHNNDAFVNGGY